MNGHRTITIQEVVPPVLDIASVVVTGVMSRGMF